MIDLHGYHIHEAWRIFKTEIDNAYYRNMKYVIVVTGQGNMMREFPMWVRNHPKIKGYTQNHWNPGSFKCHLIKQVDK